MAVRTQVMSITINEYESDVVKVNSIEEDGVLLKITEYGSTASAVVSKDDIIAFARSILMAYNVG